MDYIALWRFEPGDLAADSEGTNDFVVLYGAPASDAVDYKEGSGSLLLAQGDRYQVVDANLSDDFPCKGGTSNDSVNMSFWVKISSGGTAGWLQIAKDYSFAVFVYDAGVRLWMRLSDYSTTQSLYHLSVIERDKWYHITVKAGSEGCSIAVLDSDGEVLGDDVASDAVDLYIRPTPETGYSYNFQVYQNGFGAGLVDVHVDELAIFNISPPEKAINPGPTNGATAVSLGQNSISWVDGGLGESNEADSFNVYFGTTEGSLTLVASGLSADEVSNLFSLVDVDDGWPFGYLETRYWRIDSILNDVTTTGDVWAFTTRPIVFNIPPFPPVRPDPDYPDPWWIVPPPYPNPPGPYVPPYWGPEPIYKAAGGGRWNQQLVVAGNKKVYYEEL